MRTLPHWANLIPLIGATFAYYLGLGWLKAWRRDANLAECGHPIRTLKAGPSRGWAEIPTEEWCPAHDSWYGPETECPGCRDEWEQTWTLAEAARRDDEAEADPDREWPSAEEIAHHDALEAGRSDGWYLDLTSRAEHPSDPHSGWRDGE